MFTNIYELYLMRQRLAYSCSNSAACSILSGISVEMSVEDQGFHHVYVNYNKDITKIINNFISWLLLDIENVHFVRIITDLNIASTFNYWYVIVVYYQI